ncbi:MAG: hypothetical protein COT17_00155 [Elusimicrobia bacterium CG08_land_8_20_14_0_20_51_18]|nr:MAG: hypothetical protein COT17_00155 [Elusimicrobia bacterium CG08_land_8_20_14_0_20_51_18]
MPLKFAPRPERKPRPNPLAKLAYLAVISGFSLYFLYKSGLYKNIVPGEPAPGRPEVANPVDAGQWNDLTSQLEEAARKYPGRVGIYLKDLSQNHEWTYRPDRIFPSASLIKVPIMASVMRKVEKDAINMDTELRLTHKDRRSGSGSLKWAREGTRLSLLEIIYRMITESDNTATQMLLDYFGMNYFEEEFRNLGLAYTNITQDGMSLTSGRVAKENYTTAREMGYLLEKIYAGELISRKASETMLDILKRNKSRGRLRKGLPLGWEMGHKTGLLRTACHDAGIVFSPRGDYLIVVLTSKGPDYRSAKNFISKIAKITAAYYKYEPSFDESSAARKGAVKNI